MSISTVINGSGKRNTVIVTAGRPTAVIVYVRQKGILDPGTVLIALAGGVNQSQGLAGALSSRITSSGLIGIVAQPQVLTGSLNVAALLSISVSQSQVLAGGLSTIAALMGSITQSQILAGSLSVASLLSGVASQPQILAGSLSVGKALLGSVSQPQVLAGGLSVGNSLVASVSQAQLMAGNLTTGSTASVVPSIALLILF